MDSIQRKRKIPKLPIVLTTLNGVVCESNWNPRIQFIKQFIPPSYIPHIKHIVNAKVSVNR